MRTVKKLSVAFIIYFVYACSSSAPIEETKYFVLSPNASSPGQVTTSKTENKYLILETIKLAKFLDQAGIILQTDTHQIKVAHYHRWAEPLKHNLHRFVLANLSDNSSHQFISKENSNALNTSEVLTISIDQFHGTTNGKALLSGHWDFKQSKHDFAYQASLVQSGYTELVNQLASLLNQLCVDISEKIDVQ